jgi:hypothetical protein
VTTWYEAIKHRLSGARWSKPVAALICYLILSSALFLRLVPQGLNTSLIGWGIDQSFFVWCLKWWPYAVAHHLNPFISNLIFAPEGLNLTWSTCAPLMAWLASPLTATLGPVAAYNLLCVLCPALDAWTAFILCRHIGARFWASLIGGWLFGFSPFVVGQMLGGHLSLFPVLLLPLVVLVVLMRLEERIGARTFTLLLCALLIGQFLISTEIFATMTVMGGIMLVVGWVFAHSELRCRIQALFVPIEFAYLGAVVLLSPYLYYVLVDFRSAPFHPAEEFSTNLLNLVVPAKTTALWFATPIFKPLSSNFQNNISERGSYLGVPLLIVAGWFMFENRHTIMSRTCATLLVITIVLSMGPFVHVGRNIDWWLPWRLFTYVPLLDQALPIRLSVYAILILAVLAAMWLTSVRLPLWIRAGAAVLIIGSMFPTISHKFWHSPSVQIPTFFTDKGLYHHYLHKDETVAILPFAWGAGDHSMAWQARTGMYFRLAAGYFPLAPPAYVRWPAVRAAVQRAEIPGMAEQWEAFFASHNVSVLIVVFSNGKSPKAMRQQKVLKEVLASLGFAPVNIGGVSLYRIPPDALVRYRNATSLQMETLEDEQRFTVSLVAARQYLADGGSPASLSPVSTAQRGLFPMEWTSQEQNESDFSASLRGEPDGTISVGLMGTYPALCPLIDRYGRYAQRISFPYPWPVGEALDALGELTTHHWLVMTFNRSGLDRAAAAATAGSQRLTYSPQQDDHCCDDPTAGIVYAGRK